MASVAQAILEFGRRAPDFPPGGLSFQQIAEWMIRSQALHLSCAFNGAGQIERIDFLYNELSLGSNFEICRADGWPAGQSKCAQRKPNDSSDRGEANGSQSNSG